MSIKELLPAGDRCDFGDLLFLHMVSSKLSLVAQTLSSMVHRGIRSFQFIHVVLL